MPSKSSEEDGEAKKAVLHDAIFAKADLSAELLPIHRIPLFPKALNLNPCRARSPTWLLMVSVKRCSSSPSLRWKFKVYVNVRMVNEGILRAVCFAGFRANTCIWERATLLLRSYTYPELSRTRSPIHLHLESIKAARSEAQNTFRRAVTPFNPCTGQPIVFLSTIGPLELQSAFLGYGAYEGRKQVQNCTR